jgi:hypothetical protein
MTRRWTALAWAGLLLTGLVACGGDDEEATPLEVVRAAATETAEARTARMEMSMTGSGLPGLGDRTVAIDMDGVIDFDARTGQFTMDLSSLGIPGASGSVEMVFSDLVVYMKLPAALAGQLPKPWLKIDLAEAGRQEGIDLDALSQLGSSDPTQALDYLRGASSDITEVGREELRGTATTHYRATLDLRLAAQQLEGEQKQALEKLIATTGLGSYPAELWIDDDGRLRKMDLSIDLSQLKLPAREATTSEGAAASAGTMNVTMELFDFGVDVDVAPPPAAEVVDIAELQGQG